MSPYARVMLPVVVASFGVGCLAGAATRGPVYMPVMITVAGVVAFVLGYWSDWLSAWWRSWIAKRRA